MPSDKAPYTPQQLVTLLAQHAKSMSELSNLLLTSSKELDGTEHADKEVSLGFGIGAQAASAMSAMSVALAHLIMAAPPTTIPTAPIPGRKLEVARRFSRMMSDDPEQLGKTIGELLDFYEAHHP